MAQGTFTLFNEFAESVADGRIDLDTDTFKVILSSDGVGTIAATNAVPCYGAGGTTDLSTNEVSTGGGYTQGDKALTSVTWSSPSAGVCRFDSADVSWTSSASGDPTNIKTLVLYSDTATNKDCVGFMDLTSDGGTTAISLLAGDISITVNASGWFEITVNA